MRLLDSHNPFGTLDHGYFCHRLLFSNIEPPVQEHFSLVGRTIKAALA